MPCNQSESKKLSAAAVIVFGVCVASTLKAQSSATAGPPMPFEDVGACPFEGCVYDEGWVANRAVNVRTTRLATSPIAFRLRRGEKITALTGVVITVKPGRVRIHAAQLLHESGSRVVIQPGEELYLLTYQGEGFTKAWYNGRLYADVDVSSFDDEYCRAWPDRCSGQILERAQTVWWIQIKNAVGKVGWTNQPAAFDGKDALGR